MAPPFYAAASGIMCTSAPPEGRSCGKRDEGMDETPLRLLVEQERDRACAGHHSVAEGRRYHGS